jgi:SpoVK/Ycf46/Vps4 family AAA+-type ATPase
MNTSDQYKKELGILSKSGCGVMFTRTREPYRAMEAVKEMAFSEAVPFGQWDAVNGWRVYRPSDAPGTKPHNQKTLDPLAAMKWLMNVDGGWEPEGWQAPGYFVMHAIHPWLEKAPAMVELLRQYVRVFPTMSKKMRMVVVVPEHVSLPDEIQHDIPTVDFDLPSIEEMSSLFHYIVESSVPEGQVVPEIYTKGERETIAAAAGGLTQMEAELAFSRAIIENKNSEDSVDEIPFEKFNGTVLDAKTEVVKQSEVLELMEPVDMSEVGGLDALKEWINNAAVAFTEEARNFGVDAPAGIAAVGPPGTGKTLIGKAIATTLGQPLVKFDVSKCFGSLVGQSESRVRSALKQLEAMGRVTVLFDEIDKSLGGSHQSGGDSGVSRRVLGAILTFMQETKAPIFPIYTANRTDSLPPELLRKGRLDEVFAVMPPNREEREAILRIHLKKRKQNVRKIKDLDVAVRASRGYVSAELEAAVKEAVKVAFVRKEDVSGKLIAEMLGEMRPLAEAFPEDFARMSEWAKNNARLASTPSEEDEANEDAPSLAEVPAPRRRRIGQ